MTRRRRWFLLAAVVLFGFLLRLYRLDYQSIWSDERTSMVIAPQPLSSITTTAAAALPDSNPPLYHYVLHAFLAVFGYGVFQARFLSLLFGVLAILVIYLLAEALFDSVTGLLAAFLLAVSQLGVAYSQEVRNYALVLLLTVTAAWLFVRTLRERDKFAWFGFVLASVLAAYTHYYAVLGPAVLVGFALLRRKRYPLPGWWWVAGAAFSFALYLPWILIGVRSALTFHFTSAALQGYAKVHWSTPLSALNSFNNGKWSGIGGGSPWWLAASGFLLFTLPALYAWKAAWSTAARDRPQRGSDFRSQDSVLLLSLLAVVPVLAILAASVHVGYFSRRYLIFCMAPYYVLVAYGLTHFASRALRRTLVCLIAILSLVAVRSLYFTPSKEDNRGALAYFVAHRQPGDCAIFLPDRDSRRFWYWNVYYPNAPAPPTVSFEQIAARPDSCPRVWFVWDQTWWKNTGSVQSRSEESLRLLGRTHNVVDDRRFFRAEVILYARK